MLTYHEFLLCHDVDVEPSEVLWENLMNILNLCIFFAQNCIAILYNSLLYLLTGLMQLFGVDDVIMRVDNNYEGHIITLHWLKNVAGTEALWLVCLSLRS